MAYGLHNLQSLVYSKSEIWHFQNLWSTFFPPNITDSQTKDLSCNKVRSLDIQSLHIYLSSKTWEIKLNKTFDQDGILWNWTAYPVLKEQYEIKTIIRCQVYY